MDKSELQRVSESKTGIRINPEVLKRLEESMPKGARLFTDRGYQGHQEMFTEGRHDVNSLYAMFTWDLRESINDAVTSIQLSPGYKVTVYEHGDFTGASKTFTSSAEYVGDDFENKISSIVVAKA